MWWSWTLFGGSVVGVVKTADATARVGSGFGVGTDPSHRWPPQVASLFSLHTSINTSEVLPSPDPSKK
ncbi:hypothetical protein LWI29_031245 [Acer saccharum]|uniref:Secreted protein n=1 Tax=Acer saccharum TaxID=4024 RepID=A0AA39VEY0_ACESA|nr:hypothetical protein LWI29_031245 [Acer saccharum]